MVIEEQDMDESDLKVGDPPGQRGGGGGFIQFPVGTATQFQSKLKVNSKIYHGQ